MKVLIVPSVSSGNIPQLAVDLLIYTLGAKKVSALDPRHLYPFVGPLDRAENESIAKESTDISTAADIYIVPDTQVYIIQLRSPTLPGHRQKFVRETLKRYYESQGFDRALVVGSSNAALADVPIEKIQTVQLLSEDINDQFRGLSLSEGQSVNSLPKELPESGFVIDVLKTIPFSVAAVRYAYEGDNFSDGELLAAHVASLLNISVTKWVRPVSWKRAYGRDVPIGLEQGLYS
uniref:Proteasome assembly chaperone 2 n=1 Tax=Blastobotrys adeninivorans TaxID=409370 RepID=A0A060T2S2_BLAAD